MQTGHLCIILCPKEDSALYSQAIQVSPYDLLASATCMAQVKILRILSTLFSTPNVLMMHMQRNITGNGFSLIVIQLIYSWLYVLIGCMSLAIIRSTNSSQVSLLKD